MTPVISCSIGSYNRREHLLRAIDALAASTLREPFELCVVLDGCTDESGTAVAARFASLPAHITPILVEHPNNAGVGAAHQSAFEHTTAPVAAFIDDDCIPDPDFLSRLLNGFAAHPTAIGYGGFVRAYSRDTLNQRFLDAIEPHRPTEADFIGASFFTRLRFAVRPPRSDGVRSVYALVGGAMAFRRDALAAVGGFDLAIRFGGFETRLCELLRAQFGDACLFADPAIVVAHEFHRDLSGTFRRALRAGVGHGRNFVWRGGLPTILPNPAFVTAAVLGGLFFSPVAAVTLGIGAIALLYGRVARGRLPEALLYPLILCLEDGGKNVGFLLGVWRHRREWHRGAPPSAQVVPKGAGMNRLLTPFWLLAVIVVSLVAEPSAATQAIAVGTLLLLPGAAFLAFARLPFRSSAGRLVAAVALSVILLMATSLVLSFVGPLLGVDRPLDAEVAVPILVCCGVLLVTVGALRQRDAGAYLLRGVNVRGIITAAISLVLPLLALLGAERLDAGAPGNLAVGVTAATLLLLLAALVAVLGGRRPPVATFLFAAVLATAYAVAVRGTVLFGWDIQQEFAVALETIGRGRWVVPADRDAYAAMLSLSGLPALIGDVGRLTAAETLRYVFPVFGALTAVGVHEACRRMAPRSAALGAVLFIVVGSLALPRGMQSIARQEAAFLLVAALALVAFESRLSIRTRRTAVLVAGAGIAVAHYSTGYAMVALLLATAAFGLVIALRRPELRQTRVFTPLVVASFTALIVGWNVVFVGSIEEIERLGNSFSDDGLALLGNGGERGLLATWLSGTDTILAPAIEYQQAVGERIAGETWLQIDPAATTVQLSDAAALRIEGIASELSPAYNLAAAIVRQGVLFVSVAAVVTFLLRLRRQRNSVTTEFALLAGAALVMVVLLRVSGTAALFYNPERGALHAAILYAPVVAIVIARILKALPLSAVLLFPLLLTVQLTSAFALDTQLVGGSPSAAHANAGEEYERFAISRAEYATATWVAGQNDDPLLVSTDRYGQIALLSTPRGKIISLPTIDPSGVDRRAYVYASRTNLVEGRARGKEKELFAVFSFPVDFYSTTRATVYATEETRVYR